VLVALDSRPPLVFLMRVCGRCNTSECAHGIDSQAWVADITYIWTASGWLYLALVVDLFSRRIIGWSMDTTITSRLVVDALLVAAGRRDV